MDEVKKRRRKGGIDLSTFVYGKVPPQARELEEAVLGGILIDMTCLPVVLNIIFSDAFYLEQHKVIFDEILSIYDQNKIIDILTVVEQLKFKEKLDNIGGAYYVTKLTNSVVSTANIEYHCKIILEKYLAREAIRIGGEFVGSAYEDDTDVFQMYDKTDDEILKAQERVLSGGVKDMSYYSSKVYNQYETVKSTGILGLHTGIEPIDRIFSGLVEPDLFIIAARPSMGKCLGKGTRIIMFDGTLKNVEDIVVGDILMGDNSKPRNVISITTGIEMMYFIKQNRAINYRVNESHILSVKKSRVEGLGNKNDIIDIPVLEYIQKSNKWKSSHKGYKVSIEFNEQELPFDPYFLGLWLGDGKTDGIQIFNTDIEIVHFLRKYAKERNEVLVETYPKDRCAYFRISGGRTQKARNNSLQALFREHGLLGNKHIPHEFINNSRKNRLKLLAGIIDSDGHCNKGNGDTFEITLTKKELAEQIKYLADTLGFRTSFNKKNGNIKSIGFKSTVYRVRIGGNTSEIPCLLKRKQSHEWTDIRNWQNTGITIEQDKIDQYFGFEIDGNRRFLLEDGTVTHNTALALTITHNLSIIDKVPCAWFSLEMDGIQLARRLASIDSDIPHELIRQGKIYDSLEEKFYKSLDKVGKSPIYIEDKPSINVRSLRTRANVLVRKNGIKFIIVDYLQLMNGVDTRDTNRNNIVGEISRGLKCLAKELKIPVIALSQLSREVEKRSDKMPQNSDLRESGGIEQDADEVLFLMRPEKYGFTEPVMIDGKEYDVKGLCIGKPDKNRHGECKNFALGFIGNCMKFTTHPNDTPIITGTGSTWEPMNIEKF